MNSKEQINNTMEPNAMSPTNQSYEGVKVTSLPPLPTKKEAYRDQERVEYKRGRRGCGCSCRTITCGGCLMIVLLIVGIVFIVINKPEFLWKPIVDIFNSGSNVPTYDGRSADSAKAEITQQITKVGDNTVIINESQLAAIVRERLPDLKDLSVDIEQDVIRFFWKLDNTYQDKPLYALVEMKYDGQQLYLNKIGTPNVGLPQELNNTITDIILNRVSDLGKGDGGLKILYNLLSPDSSVSFTDLKIEKDRIVLNVKVSAGIR